MPIDTFDMEPSGVTAQHAAGTRQQPSQLAQFSAVLKKNFILQTRSRKAFFGIGGWGALLLEMFIPGLFFLLMCIPKYYIPLSPSPRQLPPAAYSLDSNSWARPYHGMQCIQLLIDSLVSCYCVHCFLPTIYYASMCTKQPIRLDNYIQVLLHTTTTRPAYYSPPTQLQCNT